VRPARSSWSASENAGPIPWGEWQEGKRPRGWTDQDERAWRGQAILPERVDLATTLPLLIAEPSTAREAPELEVVALEEFVAVDEPGAAALVGDDEGVLIPEGGDVMFYGDGGAGKTTLAVDLACHLAAGDEWLGVPVARRARVLLIENEGPRPLYRAKLRRKLAGWAGNPLGGRVSVLERPWGRLSLAEPDWRELLAEAIGVGEVDVVIAGPVSRLGMNEAGTLQEVRDFMELVREVREGSCRPVAIVLIHHENKGGKVSGAWEGAGDTLLHVQGQGQGRLRLFVQKARWSSLHHAATLRLRWAGVEGFALDEEEAPRPERVWDDIAAYVLEHGGCNWNQIDEAVSGQGEYKRRRREQMLADGLIADVGPGRRFELWHRDDPARPTIASEAGHNPDATAKSASAPGDAPDGVRASERPTRSKDARTDGRSVASPADSGSGEDVEE
jgi:hypothetical protein